MRNRTVTIPNISCEHCVKMIIRELTELDGVTKVEADDKTKTVTVAWGPPATWGAIGNLLEEIGYPPA